MDNNDLIIESFTVIDGPDHLGYYTAFNQLGSYLHLKADKKTPLYAERYQDVEGFSEGVAVVRLDSRGFHILPDGKPAYEKRYDGIVTTFQDGHSIVYVGGPDLVLIKGPDGKIIEQA